MWTEKEYICFVFDVALHTGMIQKWKLMKLWNSHWYNTYFYFTCRTPTVYSLLTFITLKMGIFYANTTAMLNLTGPENQLRLRNVTNGGPSPRRPPMSQMLNCGYCDTICIYTCIRLIFVIGVLANALMIFRVIRDKKLRSPTFIALASLAVADSLYLLFQLVLSVEFIITKMTCGTKIQFIFKHLPGFLAMFWFSASFHVTLLAAMRYIVLVHPIKTLT